MLKGDALGFFEHPFCCKISKIDGTIKKFRKEISLTVPKKKEESLIVSKKVDLLLWNGILTHVRGFGCVENEVLSTYGKVGKCALMHKKWTFRVELTKKN